MILGAHESISHGIHKSILRAYEDGCEALQIFIKNANRWSSKLISCEIKERFVNEAKKFGFDKICVHSTYLINLAKVLAVCAPIPRDAPVTSINRRSMPSATPEQSGIPASSAARNRVSRGISAMPATRRRALSSLNRRICSAGSVSSWNPLASSTPSI